MPGAHLLIVDDEENLRSMLGAALRHHGFEVSSVADGRSALDAIAELGPDLVLLDVMLPGPRRLRGLPAPAGRRQPHTGAVPHRPGRAPTTRSAASRSAATTTCRSRSAWRSSWPGRPPCCGAPGQADEDRTVLSCGDVELDDDAHQVTKAGEEVALSPTEYNLLRYLLVNQGRVLSKAQILDHVWQYDFGGDGGVVETYIGYLRRKLDTTEPKLITTIRGVGYTIRSRG